MNKIFEPTPGNKWGYKEKIPGDWHVLLGPCPSCGNRTFDYGGGWRCYGMYCDKNTSNPAPSVWSHPSWWTEDINVFKDGSAWCATHGDFINLQESKAGFGDTPNESVLALKAN